MSSKLSIIIKPEKFQDLLSKIDDLCRISDTVKLKIDKDNILLYSMLGDNILLAFKNYEVETKDYLDMKDEIEFTLNIIITGCKKFVKNLGFIKLSEKIQMEVTHRFTDDDTISEARSVVIKNGKFKLQLQAGENSQIRDINKSLLDSRLDFKNKTWSFSVNNSDFLDIKKLASINSDDSRRILYLDAGNKKVRLSELQLWELEVDDTEEEDRHYMFNKSFLSCINDNGDDIEFHVFDNFILVKDDISNLLISFEQSFD